MSDVRLETREQRRKLAPAHEPYWRSVSRGLALGYRKSPEGGQWYLRRYAGRGYHKRVLGETDDAFPSDGVSRFSWHDVLRTALAETPHDPEFRASYTVRMAFEDYFRNRRARARSAESVRFDEGKVSPFVEKFSGHRVADLTSTDLQRWRDGLIPAPSGDRTVAEADVRESKRAAQATANRVWASVRAMLNHAFSHGRVESDLAWRRVKSFSDVDQPRTRFLSVKEAQALLKHASADFRDLAHAALVSGLRLGELTRLTAGAVNEGRLHVGEVKMIGHRPQSLICHV